MGHKHLDKLTGLFGLLFAGAIAGLNAYSFENNTVWYEIGITTALDVIFSFTRGGLTNAMSDSHWDNSKTKQTLYISFGFVIVSFVFAVLVFLICIIGFIRKVSRAAKKFVLASCILVFVSNVFALLLFLMINRAFCDDLTDGIISSNFANEIQKTKICSDFRGHYSGFGYNIYWKPEAGWICELVATILSIFLIIVGSRILHAKKHGYQVIR
ncbi:hypothetical protein PPL_05829 [Heterostelium album PN500]|uniref:Transmembrane protein n=1 Tax=Heterostelium pallidum (strain ATCC 26659 / Pp 5 / PN500) TaxID=670386 RepID=D3BBG1_HETP5|nr:hypothetical protein PPL_05829 [Heterostelium album PN500]EFA80994.1 hypothetical protein PPL_05829 [Heterostelium album PN500]|eukprot:XP_020433112.1 hypothetical protein PPL_05829 [Heterostelium album PN500]